MIKMSPAFTWPPGQDRGVRGPAPTIAGQAHDTGPFELERVEGRQVETHRNGPGRRSIAGLSFRQLEQRAQQPVSDGIDVADPVAKVAIFHPGEDGANQVERAADGPLRAQALLADEPPHRLHQVPALEHEPMRFDNPAALAGLPAVELLLQQLELTVSRLERPFEAGQLRLDLMGRDPRLADDDSTFQRVDGTDHDSIRRPDSLEPYHVDATLS
jgi:hypothetical protein